MTKRSKKDQAPPPQNARGYARNEWVQAGYDPEQWESARDVQDPQTDERIRPVIVALRDETHGEAMRAQLLRGAAYMARESVIWFHTQWIAGDAKMTLDRAWLVRVGDSCACRCIQVFHAPQGEKRRPRNYFTRGPAIKYNRWLRGELKLPFEVPA